MRILQFISSLSVGGAEMIVKDYTLSLKKLGHEVMVLVFESDESWPYEKMVREAGIRVECVGPQPESGVFKKAVGRVFRRSRIDRKTLSFIKEFKPDVIHSHLDLITVISDIRGELKGIKQVFTCHNEPERIFGAEETKAVNNLTGEADFVIIALHEKMADEIKQLFPETNVVVLENPIDLHRFAAPKKNKNSLKKELKISDDAFVIGNVGRFVPQKNHDLLIEIFAKISEVNLKAFLLMIGENTAQSREKVTNKLDSLGLSGKYLVLQNISDMPSFYGIMDVFLLPSLFEGFPVSLLEAQAAGLKCVVSNTVSEEAFLTEKIIPVPLSSSSEIWRDAVMTNDYPAYKPARELRNYDLDNVIKKLLKIYNQ